MMFKLFWRGSLNSTVWASVVPQETVAWLSALSVHPNKNHTNTHSQRQTPSSDFPTRHIPLPQAAPSSAKSESNGAFPLHFPSTTRLGSPRLGTVPFPLQKVPTQRGRGRHSTAVRNRRCEPVTTLSDQSAASSVSTSHFSTGFARLEPHQSRY